MEYIMQWENESEENRAKLNAEREFFDILVLSGINTKKKHNAERHRLRPIYNIACGVAAFLCLFLTLYLGFMSKSDAAAMTSIVVPAGERSRVTLPDGSVVWLNACTTLKYPANLNRARIRNVYIDGQARFDVSHDARHPFIVHTYVADIKVLGTSFDVGAYPEDKAFETSLFDGSVSIIDPSGKGEAINLVPNQKITMLPDRFKISIIRDMDEYQWVNGIYCFKDKTFSQIITDLQRYYDKKIIYEPDPVLEVGTLTGKFRISDGFDYAMKVLQSSLKFSYISEKDTGIIQIFTK